LSYDPTNSNLPHPEIATSYNNIASVSIRQGNYHEALKYFSISLEMLKKIYGPTDSNPPHPDISASCNNIALIYDQQGQFDEALQYYSISLKLMKMYDPNDSNLPRISEAYSEYCSSI